MKENIYLKPDQKAFIEGINTHTDTKGMDLNTAHDLRNIDRLIQRYINSLLHKDGGVLRVTQKHNDVAFDNLKDIIKKRDKLINGG